MPLEQPQLDELIGFVTRIALKWRYTSWTCWRQESEEEHAPGDVYIFLLGRGHANSPLELSADFSVFEAELAGWKMSDFIREHVMPRMACLELDMLRLNTEDPRQLAKPLNLMLLPETPESADFDYPVKNTIWYRPYLFDCDVESLPEPLRTAAKENQFQEIDDDDELDDD